MKGRRWACGLLMLGLVGCGEGTPPTLSNLTMSSLRGTLGLESYARATLEDPDGDLEQGSLHLTVREVAGDLELATEAPILDFSEGRTKGEVVVGFTLFGAVPTGDYAVELVAEDEGGMRSAPVTAELSY